MDAFVGKQKPKIIAVVVDSTATYVYCDSRLGFYFLFFESLTTVIGCWNSCYCINRII